MAADRGVQGNFKSFAPMALYFHCLNHALHLVITYLQKNNEITSRFLMTLELLYTFFSSSNMHVELEEVMAMFKSKDSAYRGLSLKRVFTTRWTSFADSTEAVDSSIDVICCALLQIKRKYRERAAEAEEILKNIDFPFVYCLKLFSKVFNLLKIPTKILEKKDCDLVQAAAVLDGFVDGN